jgi:two-component system, cell cycle sensor histidine kinase and response regulator CckA
MSAAPFERPPAVSLAQTPADAPSALHLPADLPRSAGAEVVLLVDDDPGVRTLARHTLQALGYKTLVAGSAEEAVRAAAAHPGRIHLLVADIRMPGGGGGTLAAVLTARRPALRVLLMSGFYADPAGDRPAETAVPFLPKPFAPTDLARAVRRVLDQVG